MTSVLVDTNVFIDVFGPETQFKEWSSEMILRLRPQAQFVLTPIVWAELASMAPSEDQLMFMLARLNLVRESVPFPAAYQAGLAHIAYRRAGGARERTLPDFLIGAHASVRSHRLLTRDPGRYRAYFPALDLITPETHPI
ncbi:MULTISPECIES: type II toxin-antitoxin system VapC family toxin [unclassified Rhizobium]|uniref:type II toxin-antitoxin system VapC family toxin n=1 Tax=unclassified Rhizobium TaxID=2613769 RepID=UPI001ADCCF4B|nr:MULTISPECIES: type II toxin-antitoxin system VapC family toxin [unclassified Rhizobium]MBO9125544.1 type II toxin-antitoxin system VapC family toxin [Rhizobium sp. 16-488-2b]MBO9176129.1 type II toxin-antitoxin system VapC family toxin [Rhizobium sp. 16-488-2a]